MPVNIIFHYDKKVRYSINALIASIDLLADTRVVLAEGLNDLLVKTRDIVSREPRDPCVVAFSLMTTMLVENDLYLDLPNLIRKLKELNCIVVAGGPHPTGDPLGSLYNLGFDVVFIGEAEKTFRDFISALRDGGDYLSVKGLFYLDDGKPRFTGREKLIDLDQYDPFPYWRGIINPIEITRGCPYNCYYCQVSSIHGYQYRHRSIEKILFYANESIKQGCRDLRFITPNSLSYGSTIPGSPDLNKLEELLEGLSSIARRSNSRIFLGSFPSEVRPEYVDDEVLRILREHVSNKSLIIGAQSGSERILKRIHRGHSVDTVLNAVETALRHAFIPHVDVIIGFPDETPEDMLDTIKLAEEISKKGGRIHIHHYIPLPGSPFGLKTPSRVPDFIKKQLWRIIGAGRGYGQWIRQEELSWRIIELYEKGIIGVRKMVESARIHH